MLKLSPKKKKKNLFLLHGPIFALLLFLGDPLASTQIGKSQEAISVV